MSSWRRYICMCPPCADIVCFVCNQRSNLQSLLRGVLIAALFYMFYKVFFILISSIMLHILLLALIELFKMLVIV